MPQPAANRPRFRELQYTYFLWPVNYSHAEVISSDGDLLLIDAGEFMNLRDGGIWVISKENAAKHAAQYVYFMLVESSFRDRAEYEPERPFWDPNETEVVERFSLGWGRGHNVIRAVWRRSGESWQNQWAGLVYSSLDNGHEVRFPNEGADAFVTIPGLEYWAWGSSTLLSKEGMHVLMDMDPPEVVDLLPMDVVYDMQGSNIPPTARVLPVLDPVHILQVLTKKYYEACDKVLLHLGHFKSPVSPDNSAKKTDNGSIAFYRYAAATIVQGLAGPNGGASDHRAARRASEEISEYKDEHENLIYERELAADNLVGWLSSKHLTTVPRLHRKEEGSYWGPSDQEGFEKYFLAVDHAIARLPESDAGRIYLYEVLGRVEQSSSHSELAGVPALFAEFVLPSKTPSDITMDIAKPLASAITSIWGRTFGLIVAKVGNRVEDYVVGSTDQYTQLNSAVQRLLDQINYLIPTEALSLLDGPTAEVKIRVQDALATLNVNEVKLNLKPELAKRYGAWADAAATKLGDMLDALDAALAFAACREAIEKEQLDESSIASGFELAKGIVFAGEKLQQQFKSLRRPMFGTVAKEIGEDVAKQVSSRLALWMCAFDVAAAGSKTIGAYRRGDKDAASAQAIAGLGAGITLGALIVSGPVGWLVLGTALGLAGGIGASFLADDEFEMLVKHSPFGGEDVDDVLDKQHTAWAMGASYRAWTPETKKGLSTFLQAANQLQYSFSAKGRDTTELNDSQGAILELSFAKIQPQCRVHIEYDAWYSNSTKGKPDKSGRMWIINLDSKAGTADMVDYNFNWLKESDKVSNVSLDNGKLEIKFLPREEVMNGAFRADLYALTCRIRLDVQGDGDPMTGGDGASLIVPTMSSGMKWVEAKIVHEGETLSDDEDAARSVFLKDLRPKA